MELRAVRYASMVSAMTIERTEQIHRKFLMRISQSGAEVKTRMVASLGWEEREEENFAPNVQIIFVSEKCGKELTSAMLWLHDHDIDIRWARLRRQRHSTLSRIAPSPPQYAPHSRRRPGLASAGRMPFCI
jgi:hypothetical protein